MESNGINQGQTNAKTGLTIEYALTFPWSDDEPPLTLYRPVGCSACSKTGYKGRLALHEVMAVSEEIEKLAWSTPPRSRSARSRWSRG